MNMLHNEMANVTDYYRLICLEDQVNCGMSKFNSKDILIKLTIQLLYGNLNINPN